MKLDTAIKASNFVFYFLKFLKKPAFVFYKNILIG